MRRIPYLCHNQCSDSIHTHPVTVMACTCTCNHGNYTEIRAAWSEHHMLTCFSGLQRRPIIPLARNSKSYKEGREGDGRDRERGEGERGGRGRGGERERGREGREGRGREGERKRERFNEVLMLNITPVPHSGVAGIQTRKTGLPCQVPVGQVIAGLRPSVGRLIEWGWSWIAGWLDGWAWSEGHGGQGGCSRGG